jgi:hypothetical protein
MTDGAPQGHGGNPDGGQTCDGVEPPTGSCASPGDTCPFFVGAEGCGGQCVCQSDTTWSCNIYCSTPAVDAGVAEASVVPAEAAVFDAPPVFDASPPPGELCCLGPTGQDGQNLEYPPSDGCNSPPVAWEYVPTCDFTATHIELHNSGGPVGILDDTGGNPGPNLWTGLLPATPTPTWTGIDIVPPVHLVGGRTYFIYEGSGTCSIATGGTTQTFWLYDPNMGRIGPLNKFPFTFRITGTCM